MSPGHSGIGLDPKRQVKLASGWVEQGKRVGGNVVHGGKLSYKRALGLFFLSVSTLVVGSAARLGVAQEEQLQPMTVRGQIWDSRCAAAGSHGHMMAKLKASSVTDCTLECVKAGAQFVLYETDDKTIFRLDQQDKLKQYAGQTVTVIGKYDRASGTIHIDSVEAEM